MYGTIAKMRVKPGHAGGLKLVMEGMPTPPGAVSVHGYQMDSDPNEVWMAVVFENKAAYVANAGSPQQAQMYNDMMTYLEAAPEWHDGEIMFSK